MPSVSDGVLRWLLEGDPAIRWQVLQDLLDGPAPKIAKERGRVAREGWGARLLAVQDPDGLWAGGVYTPKFSSATYTLLLLGAMGLQPENRAARGAAVVLLDRGLYGDSGINFWSWRRESETCVTGMILGIASRFTPADRRREKLVNYLLGEQLADGGWNCQRSRGATHSSLHTTILTLEALLDYERAGGRQTAQTREARERAHEFLFRHQMYRSCRTGAVIDAHFKQFSFPPQWHYDVLRGLDYLRAADAPRDNRLKSAIELVNARRSEDGTWPLENIHRGKSHFAMEAAGRSSRWNTLRALRVLRWWDVTAINETALPRGRRRRPPSAKEPPRA